MKAAVLNGMDQELVVRGDVTLTDFHWCSVTKVPALYSKWGPG